MNIEIYIDEVTNDYVSRCFYIIDFYAHNLNIEIKQHQDEIISIDDAKKVQEEIKQIFDKNDQKELDKLGVPRSNNKYRLVFVKLKLLNGVELLLGEDEFIIKSLYSENRLGMYNKMKCVPSYIIQKYHNENWEDEILDSTIEKYKDLDNYHRILKRSNQHIEDSMLYTIVY